MAHCLDVAVLTLKLSYYSNFLRPHSALCSFFHAPTYSSSQMYLSSSQNTLSRSPLGAVGRYPEQWSSRTQQWISEHKCAGVCIQTQRCGELKAANPTSVLALSTPPAPLCPCTRKTCTRTHTHTHTCIETKHYPSVKIFT